MSAITALSEAKRNLLQSYLDAGSSQPRVAAAAILARASNEPAPLTISQEQLVLRETSRPNVPPLYNECIQLRMLGSLDISALRKSLTDIIRRHESWRTTYSFNDNELLQLVHPAADDVDLPIIDLQGLSRVEQEEEIQRVIGGLAQQPFSLTNGPLLRLKLIKLSDSEHRLYVIAHLSIVDGLSVYQIFLNDLATLYRAYALGRSPNLPSLPIQFRDYSGWQRQAKQTQSFVTQLDYWRTQLAGGIPSLNWPTDRRRPAQETFRGAIQQFVLPMPLVNGLKSLARQVGVTLFVTMLSLLALLLHSYTRQDDFAIGTPSPSGRKRSEVQNLLGYFLTPVALRFRLTSSMTFRELLSHAQRLTIEAISNDDLPVEALAQELNLKSDPSRNPLFTVATSLQPPMPQLDLNWTVTSMDISSGGAPWDLYIAFIDAHEGTLGRAQYNPDLFETRTIARMVQHYEELAHIVVASSERRLSDIILTPE